MKSLLVIAPVEAFAPGSRHKLQLTEQAYLVLELDGEQATLTKSRLTTNGTVSLPEACAAVQKTLEHLAEYDRDQLRRKVLAALCRPQQWYDERLLDSFLKAFDRIKDASLRLVPFRGTSVWQEGWSDGWNVPPETLYPEVWEQIHLSLDRAASKILKEKPKPAASFAISDLILEMQPDKVNLGLHYTYYE